jgi:hypothetical protein
VNRVLHLYPGSGLDHDPPTWDLLRNWGDKHVPPCPTYWLNWGWGLTNIPSSGWLPALILLICTWDFGHEPLYTETFRFDWKCNEKPKKCYVVPVKRMCWQDAGVESEKLVRLFL